MFFKYVVKPFTSDTEKELEIFFKGHMYTLRHTWCGGGGDSLVVFSLY